MTRRALLLTPIVFLGMAFREDALLLALALVFDWLVDASRRPEGTEGWRLPLIPPRPILFLPILSGALMFGITHVVAAPTHQYVRYSYAHAAAFWALQKPLLGYLLAWFIAFGPILALLIFDWRQVLRFLGDHAFFLGYLLGVVILAWIGGSTTERFVLWATPVVFVLLGRAIQRHADVLRSSILLIAALVLAQVLAYRLFWVVPSWPSNAESPLPVFELLTNHAQYADLWSWSLGIRVRSAYLLEYGGFVMVMLAWLRYRTSRTTPAAPPKPRAAQSR